MSDIHHSKYSSEIIKLYVGPERHLLTIHEAVLTKIEYFAKCLDGDRFIEGATKEIELPEDDVYSWGMILEYIYTGLCGRFGRRDSFKSTGPEFYTFLDAHFAVWTLADKYCIEALCNDLVGRMICNYRRGDVMFKEIIILFDRGLGDSKLSQLLTDFVALDLRHCGWTDYIIIYDVSLEEHLRTHSACAIKLLQAMSTIKASLQPEPYWEIQLKPCNYHVHNDTRKCGHDWWWDE